MKKLFNALRSLFTRCAGCRVPLLLTTHLVKQEDGTYLCLACLRQAEEEEEEEED